MPDAYTHQYYGNLVLSQLSPALQQRIKPHIGLFNIGLQGPDPFYFYKPLKSNPVSHQADVIHAQTGSEYFGRSLEVLKAGIPDPESGLAYQAGFMCHYTLDSTCHTFVNRYEKTRGVSHGDMEGEFERFIMIKNGLDPYKTDVAEAFIPKKEYGPVVSAFSQGIAEKECYSSLRSFKRFRNLFHCESSIKRNILYRVMKFAGVYDSYRGQVVNVEPYPNTEESNAELDKLLHSRVPTGAKLITKFYIAYDEKEPSVFLYDSDLQIPFNGISV